MAWVLSRSWISADHGVAVKAVSIYSRLHSWLHLHSVVNRLDVVRATERASARLVRRKAKIVVTSGEHVVNLVLQVSAHVSKRSSGPAVVRHWVGTTASGPAVRPPPRGEWGIEHLGRIPNVIPEQWVIDCLATVWSVDCHSLVGNHKRESWEVVRWNTSPVPVRPAQKVCGTDHCRSTRGWERVGNVASDLEKLLFEMGHVDTVPRWEVDLRDKH